MELPVPKSCKVVAVDLEPIDADHFDRMVEDVRLVYGDDTAALVNVPVMHWQTGARDGEMLLWHSGGISWRAWLTAVQRREQEAGAADRSRPPPGS